MSKITLYDSEYITVEYWEDKKLIYHVVHKPFSGQLETFKAALNSGTEALEKYQVHKWLSDNRKSDQFTEEGREWFSEWQPRTIKAGWKYWATIVPQDLAAAGTLMPIIEQLYKFGLRMMVFTNVEEALEWLDSMSND